MVTLCKDDKQTKGVKHRAENVKMVLIFVSFTAVMISNMFRLNRADKQTALAVLLGCKTIIFTIINYHYWQCTEILEYYAFQDIIVLIT